jgi:hypothetical protein
MEVKHYHIGWKSLSIEDFKAYNYHFLLRITCTSIHPNVFETPWSQLLFLTSNEVVPDFFSIAP